MKIKLSASIAAMLFFVVSQAHAVPVLQVGAPGASGQGYAPYASQGSNPTEADTAITSGNLLYVAGTYRPGTVLLGGKSTATNQDWTYFGMPAEFNGKGAILVASVEDGTTGDITVDGLGAFYTSSISLFPNPHDPVKSGVSDFLYFDLGNFANNEKVADFADGTGAADGEIMELLINVLGYDWVHFDVMALMNDTTSSGEKKTKVASTGYETDPVNNPGSHDVTWKETQPVPEPGTVMLLGAGAVITAFVRRRKKG